MERQAAAGPEVAPPVEAGLVPAVALAAAGRRAEREAAVQERAELEVVALARADQERVETRHRLEPGQGLEPGLEQAAEAVQEQTAAGVPAATSISARLPIGEPLIRTHVPQALLTRRLLALSIRGTVIIRRLALRCRRAPKPKPD